MPLNLQIALSQLVAEGKPIPADWALAWYVHSPQARLRTPAKRCVDEFRQLFRLQYEQQYGQGLVIKPNKTRLKVNYQPASKSFDGPVELDIGDLPNVTALSAPFNRLETLVDKCTNALEPLSRWIGRNPDARGSHAVIALLLPELVGTCESESASAFCQWLEQCLSHSEQAVVSSRELLQHWSRTFSSKFTKAEAVVLSQFLEKQGYGIEPDIRFGCKALTIEGNLVLFRCSTSMSETLSPKYTVATLLLHLGTVIASADSVVKNLEQACLEWHLESALNLSEPEQCRLRAHLKWILQEKPSLRELKPRLEVVTPDQRVMIGQFLISVAGANGHISPKEISVLTKIFPLLGLDPQAVLKKDSY